jgi:peptidyl-prolyl cis-trans isomerase C
VKRLLQEPLLHFLLVGVVLFAAYSYQQRGRSVEASAQEIRLTLDELAQLELVFESQWQRPPTPDEFGRLVENKVQEEVLYREAVAMGLDQDDTIVKRRMAQKMQFLAEDVAAAREPTREELQAWFENHRDLFALPARRSFRHLYFSTDRRGERAESEASEALARLGDQPQDSKLADSLADPFMFQDYYADSTPEEMARDFGPAFAQAVAKLAPGSWQGPVESGLGWHLVFVDTAIPSRFPSFEEVEPDVRNAWLGEQKAEAWRRGYAELRAKYTVLLPVPPDGAAAAAPASSEAARPPDALARDDGVPR